MNLAALRQDFRMDYRSDPWGQAMGALFPICEELHCRLNIEGLSDDEDPDGDLTDAVDAFLSDAGFRPPAVAPERYRAHLTSEAGRDPANDRDGGNTWAANAADAGTADLLRFARIIQRLSRALRRAGKDY